MERLVGVDVTRGLAVLGMVAAHVGPAVAYGAAWWSPERALDLADGRPAATFAFLAGLSAALLARRDTPVRASVRVLTRAVLLWPIGAFLIALGTPVAVILPGYAVMLAVVAPLLRVRSAVLLGLAGVAAVLGPPVVLALRGTIVLPPGPTAGLVTAGWPQVADVLAGEHYPALVWIAYVLVGVVVGRMDLTAGRTLRKMALVGAAWVVVGELVLGRAARAGVEALADGAWVGTGLELLSTAPHADTTPELLRNLGASLLVLAAALALTQGRARRIGRAVLTPLTATGALALTAYVGHIVVLAASTALGRDLVREATTAWWLALTAAVVAFCWVWWATLGRGPLELVLHRVSSMAADAVGGPREPQPAEGSPGISAPAPAVPRPPT